METRPFYKRVMSLFKRDPAPIATSPETHNYPLSEPKPIVRVRRRERKYRNAYRNPPMRQEPSNDPRFNHALRRTTKKL